MRKYSEATTEYQLLDRDTIILLRIPYSVYLLPVFLFALSQADKLNAASAVIFFLILHLLIYPASNGYNSYMDQDQGSIGALKNPPAATKKLFWVSNILDVAALMLSIFIHPVFPLLILVYIASSRLYSWRKTRIKKYPFGSWLLVFLVQGVFTYIVSLAAIRGDFDGLLSLKSLLGGLISGLMVGSVYPISQIFQHDEDHSRGDISLSIILGKRNTLLFSGTLFFLLFSSAVIYFKLFANDLHWVLFLVFLAPTMIYFLKWLRKMVTDENAHATYENAMGLNNLAAPSLIVFFTLLYFLKDYIISLPGF